METTASKTYAEKRREFYANFPSFWCDIEGREFALYGHRPMATEMVRQIREATEAMGAIYFKMGELLRVASNDVLLGLGIPEAALDFSRLTIPGMPSTVMGRFDFVATHDGLKMLEFNAETPFFVLECFEINGQICRQFGVPNPNALEKGRLARAFTEAVEAGVHYVGKSITEEIVVGFCSYKDYPEDPVTARFYMDLLKLPENVKLVYVDVLKMTIDQDGLYDEHGTRIDVLHRLYPVEYLAYDYSEDGRHIGGEFFQLVADRKLATINPPSAFLLQTKATQAMIWGLADQGVYFTPEECATIRRYMLPTFMENRFGDKTHVEKVVFGREGASVRIIEGLAEVAVSNDWYDGQALVYQQFVNLPVINIETEEGHKNVYAIIGSFLVGGSASAIGIRAGGLITDNSSYFVPISV